MKCVKCGHELFSATTVEAVDLEDGILVIRKIPCHKCSVCDEIHLSGDVVQRLEQIIANAKEQMQEVAIMDFSKAA